MPPEKSGLEQALRELALRLLGQREHSVQELRRKLYRKVRADPQGFPRGDLTRAIGAVIRALVGESYLDDHRFALALAHQRRSRRCHGNLRIRRDLERRGINAKIIDSLLSEISDSGEALREAIALHVRRHGQPSAMTDLQRLFRRLLRLGHSPAEVRRELRTLFKKAGNKG
ncbi:MAG: RecX family transcriptional regulator [Acidobacteria bacterium]|nr:RecX family transcriptional regulator [Acidobacteriota bacterium]